MKKIVKLFLLSASCFMLLGCPYFPYDEEEVASLYPFLVLCKFKNDCETYYDNAWICSLSRSYYPQFVTKYGWLQPPYPMGDGWYMWVVEHTAFYPDEMRYLSTTREEWNDGNQVVEDSLVVCEDPYQDYFMLARFHREIVKDHITIAENTETDERENQYIVWVDTAWFRKNIIESRGDL